MKMKPNNLILVLLFSTFRIIFESQMITGQNTTIPVNVGVVLDMNSFVGKMGLSCISMALSDFYASHGYYKTRVVLKTRDSEETVGAAAAAALDLLENDEVQAIIGPESSMQAKFLIKLGDIYEVPIISFSATSPSLQSKYFIRANLNDSSQVKAITSLIKSFNLNEVVPIYSRNEYGEGIIPFLINSLQEINDTRVPYQSIISASATDKEIITELKKLMNMTTRVFVVHMLPALGSRLFIKAKELGMMSEGYVWIITDGITNVLSSFHPSVIDSMQGVLGLKPYISPTKKLENFTSQWKKKFQQNNPTYLNAEMNVFGLWAYDVSWALAMAIEKVRYTKIGIQKGNFSNNSTNFEIYKDSKIGEALRNTLSSTRLIGLSGDFHIENQQLQFYSAFEIVNVIGNGYGSSVGFWTPESWIVKNLSGEKEANSLAIIWPGYTTSAPKGWGYNKKLRIAVPITNISSSPVNVTRDLNNPNNRNVIAYCIAVFDAVMAELPYHIAYEYVPFSKPDGTMAGTYNDLVRAVSLGEFDAAVGDITITTNRSSIVDFTLPYTESGVTLVVPVKEKKKNNAWIFLKPLTWELWVTSACFFVFIGFLIWIVEHPTDENFIGPRPHGTSIWLSFTTVVSENRERVMSNLARFVMIIWCFVVLILTQSYTASLTSILTAQRLEPTITGVRELIDKGVPIGYPEGSFIKGILEHDKNIQQSNLRGYRYLDDLDKVFSKGIENGGVAAAFDETPYMKLFVAKYCPKYTMVENTHRTAGFGFVFPKGSPLVSDVSRAVLKVLEGRQTTEIMEKLIGQQNKCPDPNNSVSFTNLNLGGFWGLFVIIGVASSFALIIFIVMLVYEHRHSLMQFDLSTLMGLSTMFDGWSKKREEERNGIETPNHSSFSNQCSPSSDCPHRPSDFSYDTDGGTPLHIVPATELTNTNQQREETHEIVHDNRNFCNNI